MYLKNFVRGLSYQKLISWYSGLVKRPPPSPPYTHVTQIGDPVLRSKAEPVSQRSINTTEIQKIVAILKFVLRKYKCVGLAAPQIGIPLRICVVEFQKEHLELYDEKRRKLKEMSLMPMTVLINPELKIVDFTKVSFPEACASIKGFYSNVPRYKAIEVKALSEFGEEFLLEVKGWNSRIIQHEVDHLNGTLYTDIMDRKSFTCSCWEEVNERRGKNVLPFLPE